MTLSEMLERYRDLTARILRLSEERRELGEKIKQEERRQARREEKHGD